METVEAYLKRKVDELRLLNNCLKDPLSLPSPRSVSEIVQQKFQVAAALKAEHALRDWAATETAWATVQQRSGPFEFTYDYQRADLAVRGPSFYDLEVHRVEETVFTSSGMAAIAALFLALAKSIDQAKLLLAPGAYGETQELVEGYTRNLRPIVHDRVFDEAMVRSSPCQIIIIDSAAPSSIFEAALRLKSPTLDLLIFDTTCFAAGSGRIRRVISWSRRWGVPLVMVRSHTKLDSLGTEYGRLGSAVFVDWNKAASSGRAATFQSLPDNMRNALRLIGGAALPAHFPPYVGTPSYRKLTNKRTSAILRNTRRASQYFSHALPNLTAELRFAHGLYITLKSAKTLSEKTARETAISLSEDLGRSGLPIRHAGSFGFDFAATEWFHDRISDQYVVRISVPDLPALLWDKLTQAVAKWWLAHERKPDAVRPPSMSHAGGETDVRVLADGLGAFDLGSGSS